MKTKRFFATVLAAAAMGTAACAQQTETGAGEPRVLVAYFSATGTTAEAARKVARATGGELFAIRPAEPYTATDLDWTDKRSRCSVEMADPKSRPALAERKADIARYDTVYLGYPIWWGVAPAVVRTFVESHALEGKTVVPFATSGGSGIGRSVEALRASYPSVRWAEGRLLNGMDEAAVRRWTSGVK